MAAVQIVHHFLERGEAAGHVAQEVELVAVVDADVGIDGPEEDGIDAAVAAVEVVEETVDGVPAGGGVVEVAVFHHGLGLDEGALRPLEFGARVEVAGETGADAAFGAVARDLGEPLGRGVFGGRAGDLLAVGRVLGVLRGPREVSTPWRRTGFDAIRIQ